MSIGDTMTATRGVEEMWLKPKWLFCQTKLSSFKLCLFNKYFRLRLRLKFSYVFSIESWGIVINDDLNNSQMVLKPAPYAVQRVLLCSYEMLSSISSYLLHRSFYHKISSHASNANTTTVLHILLKLFCLHLPTVASFSNYFLFEISDFTRTIKVWAGFELDTPE